MSESSAAMPGTGESPVRRTTRLTPAKADAVLRACVAGVPIRVVARTYEVSPTTVSRIAATVKDPSFVTALDDLSELVDAEDELRQSNLDPGRIEFLINAVRLGHLIRRDLQRRDRQRRESLHDA